MTRSNKKTRIVRRYTGDARIWDGAALQPGQFISKATFDRLPKRDTIKQEISRGQ
jgi:hypothetical protein